VVHWSRSIEWTIGSLLSRERPFRTTKELQKPNAIHGISMRASPQTKSQPRVCRCDVFDRISSISRGPRILSSFIVYWPFSWVQTSATCSTITVRAEESVSVTYRPMRSDAFFRLRERFCR
jgi:hypothetical protein